MIFKEKAVYVSPFVEVETIDASAPLCGSWQKDPVIGPGEDNDLGEY